MSTRWTENQKRAIDARFGNTIVSAAAGSGKTAVLVERVINMITDSDCPIDIDKMLIATFTNAAASEMRERIHNALIQRLDESPESSLLQRQLMLLNGASINTIHAFCQNLIRNNFDVLGISSNFEIGDETTLAMIKQTCINEVLDKYYNDKCDDFLALVDGFGGKRDDSAVLEMILKIYNFAMSTPFPEQWLSEAVGKFLTIGDENEYITDIWGRQLLEKIKLDLGGMVNSYDNAISIIESSDGLESYYSTFCDERDMLFGLLKKCNATWNEMYEFVWSVSFTTLPRKAKGADEAAVAAVKAIRDGVKKDIGKIRDIFYATASEICKDNKTTGRLVGIITDITIDFANLYSQKKLDKNMLDFNDLEHYAIKLLTSDAAISAELQKKYAEILVDEFQDTNGVQAKIFEIISNGNNLFVVGDVKQSIYGFRNAQPKIFMDKLNIGYGNKVILSHNFRSCEGILDFVNYIFEPIMSAEVGEVAYSDDERLVCGNPSHESGKNAVEVHILEKNFNDADLTDEELQNDDISREAMFVARRIIKLVEAEKREIFDKKAGIKRPVEYRDIVILSRTTSGVSSVFSKQLADFGVPVYSEETGGYFMSVEIATIIAFLKILDNPLQDIPVIAVLRSPMFMFSDDELANIRTKSKKESFFNLLKQSENKKCIDFIKKYYEYCDIKAYSSIEYLIRHILEDTGYYSFVGTMPGGDMRMANLRLLCERAGAFESREYRNIFDFLQYIDSMTESGIEYSSAKVISQNDNVVTIMSIHKSKGLEFPVVFLVGCGRIFNKTDLREKILYDLNMGIGADFIDTKRNIKYKTISKIAIEQKKSAELLSEQMRVLYVAITRPRDMLFIVGSAKNVYDKIEKWQNSVITPYAVSKCNTFLDWIGLAVADKNIIEVHNADDIFGGGAVVCDKISDMVIEDDFSLQIAERLSYAYPYANAKKIHSKMSVSDAVYLGNRKIKLAVPDFRKKTSISAATRGTVIHFVMQNLDIENTSSIQSIRAQVDDMVNKDMLCEDFGAVVDCDAIFNFFESDLGKRLKASKNVKREFKFFVDMPASIIVPDLEEELQQETILLQGVVDCYFEEEDEIVIIDYKTGINREEYQKQLDFYAFALSKALNKNIKETFVFSV